MFLVIIQKEVLVPAETPLGALRLASDEADIEDATTVIIEDVTEEDES